jgi:hypothetical protein
MAATPRTKLKENLIRGDTPVIRIPVTVKGVAVDLSGWKCTMSITDQQAPSNSTTPIIQIPVTGDTTGILNYQLLQGQTNNDTLQLDPAKTYYGDVELNNNQTGAFKRVFTPIRFEFSVDYDYTVGTV